MYTVLRLYFEELHRPRLPEVAVAINQISADACTGEDREPLRMSCTIAESRTWDVHAQEIYSQLVKIMPEVNRFGQILTNKEIDILIESEDWQHSSFDEYLFEHKLLQLLAQEQIELVLSISRP